MTFTARARLRRFVSLRRVSPRGAVIKELDGILREIILIRDGYRCRKCGHGPRPGRGGGLQAAHLLPKGRFPSMRYVLENVVLLCASCHIYGPEAWHKDPDAAKRWADAELGPLTIPNLRLIARMNTGKRQDLTAVRLYLEGELNRLKVGA